MPKKNGETVEGEAPVKKAPAATDYHKLQSDRRALEAELALIDSQIRASMNSGELADLDRFVARKAELPRLFIAASNAERQARREKANAEDEANLAALQAAESTLTEANAAQVALKLRHEEEMAAMKAELSAAEAAVRGAYNAVEGARTLASSSEVGFKKSLAGLASV